MPLPFNVKAAESSQLLGSCSSDEGGLRTCGVGMDALSRCRRYAVHLLASHQTPSLELKEALSAHRHIRAGIVGLHVRAAEQSAV